MHIPGDTRGQRTAVWDPSQEVAAAIRRAAEAFVGRRTTVSQFNRCRPPKAHGTRVAICDDSPLFLAGLEHALLDLGMIVSQQTVDVGALERSIQHGDIDLVIIDVAQPPTFSVEGIIAAQGIRHLHPGLPTLLLSSNVAVEGECALATLEADCRALGYLNKDRLTGGPHLLSALSRLLEGGTVVDPDVVSTLIVGSHVGTTLERLSARERQSLELVAQGLTNAAIARQMFLSLKTVEANIASLFSKLGLPVESSANRRVLATLTYLRASQGRTPSQ